MVGSTVGDYKITDKLGEGGFGVVYKGVHRLLEQEVAIKTLALVLTRDPKFRQRFFDEAKTQARLKHPNIVTLHNFFEHDGQYFIVMEYLEGMTLPGGQRVKNLADLVKLGPVPEDRARQLFGQMLAGVACAHQHGVLHRDIKPLNILFAESGLVKVADFGIAKIVGGDTNISLSGTRVGTPAYMSPEQVLNKPLDLRTDIYSLGCTLYEMCAGAMPFRASSTTSLEEQHLSTPPPRPRQKNPWLSERMERVILKAMEKKPPDRFQTCEEFAAAIEGRAVPVIEPCEPVEDRTVREVREPRPAERVAVEERATPKRVRGRRSAMTVVIVLVGLAVLGIGGYLALRKGTAPAVVTEFSMPDFAAATVSDARRLSQDKGLVFVVAESVLSDVAQKGAVVTSRPAAGATVKKGDTVRVTWCWGRRTCPECRSERKSGALFCTKCGYRF